MQVGDQLLAFGTACSDSPGGLQAVAQVVQVRTLLTACVLSNGLFFRLALAPFYLGLHVSPFTGLALKQALPAKDDHSRILKMERVCGVNLTE